ncbi:MAG: hypothetical protein ACUVTY_12135 [Armatimonadota bacterium]
MPSLPADSTAGHPPQYDSRTELWMVQELVKRVAPELYHYFDLTELDAIRILLETGGKETEGITVSSCWRVRYASKCPTPNWAR